MLLCFTLILSACTQLEADTPEYSGVIVDDKVMGYEYTVAKEGNSFYWKVGYRGDITTIEESIDNTDELQNFMMAVSDIKLIFLKLILSLSHFIMVAVISFFLFKRRKILKDSAIVVALASIIALYIAIDASFDLSFVLQDIKLHYLRLTN